MSHLLSDSVNDSFGINHAQNSLWDSHNGRPRNVWLVNQRRAPRVAQLQNENPSRLKIVSFFANLVRKNIEEELKYKSLFKLERSHN